MCIIYHIHYIVMLFIIQDWFRAWLLRKSCQEDTKGINGGPGSASVNSTIWGKSLPRKIPWYDSGFNSLSADFDVHLPYHKKQHLPSSVSPSLLAKSNEQMSIDLDLTLDIMRVFLGPQAVTRNINPGKTVIFLLIEWFSQLTSTGIHWNHGTKS